MKRFYCVCCTLLATCLSLSLGKAVAAESTANPQYFDMAPLLREPAGLAIDRQPSCQISPDRITMANANLRCEFKQTGDSLRLVSLYNELTAAEMVRDSQASHLFVVEVGGKPYSGSRDFIVRRIKPLTDHPGFEAMLFCPAVKMKAVLTVQIDDDLRMGLSLANRGDAPIHFTSAFPHVAGLAVSKNPGDDYYFYPLGGGVISKSPCYISGGYGDYMALYQVMDLFSPGRGGGLAVWCIDDDGRYKMLSLRKHIPGEKELWALFMPTPTADEFKCKMCLDETPGTGIAYQYLRRTRKPGESFTLKDVVFRAHAGDWHAAMKMYSDWCHRVWKWRPYPSRLTPVNNMVTAGWGTNLFDKGKYCVDAGTIARPQCDCLELMSWWEWSPLGPWNTPIDQLQQQFGEKHAKEILDYCPTDPVTGKRMYKINRGDYDGYNIRWGGLPAFREAIKTYKQNGKTLVTLYTDPLLACGNTKCGQKYGAKWCGVNPDGTPRKAYDSWYMCHDVAEYRQFVADTMGRVIRETDADGIRLDEYGHAGYACFSKEHKHTFAEWGCTEWHRSIAEAAQMIHKAMDDVKPGTVLTTEHPDADFLMSKIEGCITYDLWCKVADGYRPLRPLECNLQRFYFPECKPFELDMGDADPTFRKRFWNAVGTYGATYPANMDAILRENGDAFSSRDCDPLIPTIARYVYVNRFRSERKAIYTIYNTRKETFEGPVLRIPRKADQHIVDLLRGQEVQYKTVENDAVVHVKLASDDVTCLAVLPKRLQVRRNGDRLEITVPSPDRDWQVYVCNADGKSLAAPKLTNGVANVDLHNIDSQQTKPFGVKLTVNDLLIDFAPIPPTSPTTTSPGI